MFARLRVVILACGFLALPVISPSAWARVLLFDGSLELTGYVKEYMLLRTRIPRKERRFHASKVDLSQTGFLMEALYRLRNDANVTCNLFGGLRYWYEKAPAFDAELKRGIPFRARKDYVRPRDDAHITEAYLDVSAGRWQVVLGKQIVVWGETDIVRTADVVNPLDLRYAVPGIDFWEELKRGLWMVRGLYQSRLPGDPLFEIIFIPGDFQHTELPYEGTHWGLSPAETSPNPGRIFGYGHWLLEKMRRDSPGWNLKKNYDLGLRIRGYTWNIDWTFIYFDTLSDTATADPARSFNFSLTYAAAALGSALSGAEVNPAFPGYRVFRYKRYRVFGGTAQTVVEWLRGSVWRLEWFYEAGQHFNRAQGGQLDGLVYDEVRRDSYGFGVSCSDKFKVPYLTHAFFSDKLLELSVTFFYEKILNYDRDIVVDPSRGHRIGDSHASMIIWNLIQPIKYQIWTFVFAGFYNPNGMYFLFPLVSYAPGNHWRWEAGAAIFGYRSASAKYAYHDKDSILLRVRYEW